MSSNVVRESDSILKMRDWGDFLGTRAVGERVRDRILSAMRESNGQIILDFDGVHGMTQSFADEAFRKLLSSLNASEVSRIVIRGASDDVHAVLRYATSRKTMFGTDGREPSDVR